MSEYNAELDLSLLEKWCNHHSGTVDDPNFATILMGVFLEGKTPEVEEFLRRFSQFYDFSLFTNLMRICDESALDDAVEPWIRADLKAKRHLFANEQHGQAIVQLIDSQQMRPAHSRDEWFDALEGSEHHSLAYHIVNEYALQHVRAQGLEKLIEPLYHISNSYDLVYGILAGLMNSTIDFSNYLEVYLRGADYLFDTDSVLVIKHADMV